MRHVSAGPRARKRMADLLTLHGGPEEWSLEGLCGLDPEHVRLSLKKGPYGLVFYLLPPDPGKARVRGRKVDLAAEAEAPALPRFLERMAERLGDLALSDVLAILEDDPDSFTQDATPGRPGDNVRVPCIGQPIELLEAGWRNFFADQDFEVLLGVPGCSPNGTVNIQYTDLECYYSRPKLSFRKWTFLDWPEDEEGQEKRTPRDPGAGSSIVTELEERDMILGTGERAEALVQEARRLAQDGKTLVFTHLCTPIVMGEDFQGLARRCAQEAGGATVSWSQKDRDSNDNFGEFFRDLLARPGFFEAPADPEAVNLFHFPKPFRDEELRPLLEACGLKVNVCVFPDVEFPALERLPRAAWQVFCERSSYPTKVREMLASRPRPVLSVRAPYGVAGTRECLRAVAAAAGKDSEFAAAWAGKMEGFLPAWEALRREAAAHRLAFVVSEATLPRLLKPRYGHGAPAAAVVQEMGFGIDLLYYDIHGEEPALPQGLEGARVACFRSPWELQRALTEGGFDAVYSDVFFDWRVSRAGKARFSGRDFEMGLEGARRTCRRLLSACRLPFFRRYGRHLVRAGGNRDA